MIIALVAVILIELLLSVLWNRRYFGWGLPVFTQRIAATPAALTRLPFNWLEGDYPPARWATLVFEPLSDDSCAFRETLLMHRGPGYVPVMRGLIVADRRRREVRVIGWCNWSIVMMAAIAAAGLVVKPVAALFFLGMLAVSYLVQRRRFQNVAVAVGALLQTSTGWKPPVVRAPTLDR